MHSGTLVNRPAGLIISSLGLFAFLVRNRISDIGNKGRLHLPPSKTRKSNFWRISESDLFQLYTVFLYRSNDLRLITMSKKKKTYHSFEIPHT